MARRRVNPYIYIYNTHGAEQLCHDSQEERGVGQYETRLNQQARVEKRGAGREYGSGGGETERTRGQINERG